MAEVGITSLEEEGSEATCESCKSKSVGRCALTEALLAGRPSVVGETIVRVLDRAGKEPFTIDHLVAEEEGSESAARSRASEALYLLGNFPFTAPAILKVNERRKLTYSVDAEVIERLCGRIQGGEIAYQDVVIPRNPARLKELLEAQAAKEATVLSEFIESWVRKGFPVETLDIDTVLAMLDSCPSDNHAEAALRAALGRIIKGGEYPDDVRQRLTIMSSIAAKEDASGLRMRLENFFLPKTEVTSEEPEDEEPFVWQDYANCLGVDPDLFFPERGASTREAKEVCRGCVVRADCLEYALKNSEKFGIWGGMSERERRRLRRQRALAKRGEDIPPASS